jgi:glycine/D-amino acid oxidase-like deaminating enzyme
MRSTRRGFFKAAGGLLASPGLAFARELVSGVAVIGGGTGGCAAAIAAARNGMQVIMTEETDWVGGQLTSQAVPPDEHAWIESFGCTRSYRDYRQRVRDYYRRNYPLTEEARRRPDLNPGNGRVSRLTHEPRVSLAVLEEMLASFVSSGRVIVLLRHKPVAADVAGDFLRAVTVRDLETGRERTISAPYFLDATEQGDLLPPGSRRVRDRVRVVEGNCRAARAARSTSGQHSGIHLLFRHGSFSGGGSPNRKAR